MNTNERHPMLNKPIVRIAGIALAAGAALTASACATPASDTETSESSQVIAPIIIDAADLNGQTIKVGIDNVMVINTSDVTGWTAEFSDPSIAEFVPGSIEGDSADPLIENPGIAPLAIGETTVTMTSTDGVTATFTLIVTPAMNG
jgi:hypothetical protein